MIKLKSELEAIKIKFNLELDLIRRFTTHVGNFIKREPYEPEYRPTDEDVKYLREVFNSVGKEGKMEYPIEITVPVKSEGVYEILLSAFSDSRFSSFFSEMILSYAVAHQEAFIKDAIYTVLVNRRNLLKDKGTITHEKLLSYENLDDIVKELAKKQSDSLGYGNIVDDAKDYFLKKFNVKLDSFSHWEKLRESVFRRNLIIHNRGVINDKYIKATNYSGEFKKLDTDIQYVIDAIDRIRNFVGFCTDALISKFNKKT